MQRRAVVLLSGGLDSATVLAMARRDGFAAYALSFRYGQRHRVELEAAVRVARALGAAAHRIVDLDLGWMGGSALTSNLEVPKDRSLDEMGKDIPITYVPARNTLFLSYALAWAETLAARDLYAGMNALDYSGYPDCRPEFLAAFEHLADVGTRAGVLGATFSVHAPLLRMSKAEIIHAGSALGVDFGLTHSCYDPAGALACGRCDACLLRRRGFAQAGVPDPTHYVI